MREKSSWEETCEGDREPQMRVGLRFAVVLFVSSSVLVSRSEILVPFYAVITKLRCVELLLLLNRIVILKNMRCSFFSTLVLSITSTTAVSAFVIRDLPVQATAVRNGYTFNAIPKPTAAPVELELRRRQVASQRTLLGAVDNTCGNVIFASSCMSLTFFHLSLPVIDSFS